MIIFLIVIEISGLSHLFFVTIFKFYLILFAKAYLRLNMSDNINGIESKERRNTVVVYKTSSSDSTNGSKEKLSSYKNLMYSVREAELIEDTCHFLIEKCPRYAIN